MNQLIWHRNMWICLQHLKILSDYFVKCWNNISQDSVVTFFRCSGQILNYSAEFSQYSEYSKLFKTVNKILIAWVTYLLLVIMTCPTDVDGRLCFCWYRYIYGANSSPIITRLHQPWTGDEVIKFCKVKVDGGCMCSSISTMPNAA